MPFILMMSSSTFSTFPFTEITIDMSVLNNFYEIIPRYDQKNLQGI